MDLRVLRYFLTVAEEGGITRAAERLHVSQPALSTQLAALEEEFGHKLFARSARGITLTAKGLLLKYRADDLVKFAARIESEMLSDEGCLTGTITIGAAETPAFQFLARAAERLYARHSCISFSLLSGDGEDITSRLKDGTIDLAVLLGPGHFDGLKTLKLPYTHLWGLAIRQDSPLARKETLSPQDVRHLPLLCPNRKAVKRILADWVDCPYSKLNVTTTYNLIYNALPFVASGMGAAFAIDGLIPQDQPHAVTFRPFAPAVTCDVYLAWRKDIPLPPAAAAFIDEMRRE